MGRMYLMINKLGTPSSARHNALYSTSFCIQILKHILVSVRKNIGSEKHSWSGKCEMCGGERAWGAKWWPAWWPGSPLHPPGPQLS